jgi:Ni/Fe-hydrogenase subunit HybB-like protein
MPNDFPFYFLLGDSSNTSMLYLSGAGFSFPFLSIISDMGRFLPLPNVHDFDVRVVGIYGSMMSVYSTL